MPLSRRALMGGLLATTAIPGPALRPAVRLLETTPITASSINAGSVVTLRQWAAFLAEAEKRLSAAMAEPFDQLAHVRADLAINSHASVFVPGPR